MTKDEIIEYCRSKKHATYDFPFDDETMVIRVGNKMFALINIKSLKNEVNLKCDPFLALELREIFPGIRPGYHMNKKYWNTVDIDSEIPDEKIIELIDHSYEMVFSGLTKKLQRELSEEN